MLVNQPHWSINLTYWKWRNKARVYDYDSAEAWLSGARSITKRDRSLYEGSWIRLHRISRDSIAVRYTMWIRGQGYVPYDVITYRKDGVTILDANGAIPAQGLRNTFQKYVPGIAMVQRKYRTVIVRPIDGLTPSKIQTCRSCKGAQNVPTHCYSYSVCRVEDCTDPQHRSTPTKWGYTHNTHPCAHGKHEYHIDHVNLQPCWNCKGAGQRDYGQKQTGVIWDGHRVGLTADYQFIPV